MKQKLLTLTLLTTLSSSLFAQENKKTDEFTAEYRRQVLQSVVFGKTKVMKSGDELTGSVGTSAIGGAGGIAGASAISGATASGVAGGAVGGLLVGAVAGLVVGGVASAANASTIECMDNAVNNGEKMGCASTSFAHTGQLFAQSGLGYVTGINEDGTKHPIGAFWEDNPATQKLQDGSIVFKYACINGEYVPSVITVKGKYMGKEYAAKYPESQGYEWLLISAQKYNKPVVIRNLNNKEEWDTKVTPFLNDPANFIKS